VPAQVLGQREGGFHRGIRTRDEKLAAPARDDVAFVARRAQARGHRNQHLVTGRVPVRIVDVLEVVDIDHQQGATRPAARRQRRQLGDQAIGLAPVHQPGQRVMPAGTPARRWRVLIHHKAAPPTASRPTRAATAALRRVSARASSTRDCWPAP
jgi:hypothetical protein